MNSAARMRFGVLTFCALAIGACLPPSGRTQPGPSLFARDPIREWRLPNRLREISGLAMTPDGRLFAHDDEHAVLYEIDIDRGEVGASFSLGDPPVHGDFEAITITPQGDFWLTTSRGKLYRFREGADGAHVPYERFDSGLDHVCEIEGLAYLASANSLILACKTNHARAMRHTLALYSWPIGSTEPATLWRSLPESAVTSLIGTREFRPSEIQFDAASGRILLLSGHDGALAELSPDGQVIAARALGRDHPQAEGLALAANGDLVISDEGAGQHARIAIYGRVQ